MHLFVPVRHQCEKKHYKTKKNNNIDEAKHHTQNEQVSRI